MKVKPRGTNVCIPLSKLSTKFCIHKYIVGAVSPPWRGGREVGLQTFLVTNSAPNLSPNSVTNSVITKFGAKYGDKFGDKISEHPFW